MSTLNRAVESVNMKTVEDVILSEQKVEDYVRYKRLRKKGASIAPLCSDEKQKSSLEPSNFNSGELFKKQTLKRIKHHKTVEWLFKCIG